MKVGTFVEHIQWGKGIIIEELPHINGGMAFPLLFWFSGTIREQ